MEAPLPQSTFYLVRHGEAENNVRFILDSLPERKGYPLTEQGRRDVAETAMFLKSVGAEILFSSPIRRTRETAEIISEATGLPIYIDSRLCEAGFGAFNGHSIKEFFAKYKTSESRLAPDPTDGVESFLGIRERLTDFLNDVRENCSGKKIIIVSHGDTLEQLHGILTREAPGRSATGWYPKKGSCTEVIWKE